MYLNSWVTEIGGFDRIQTNVNSLVFGMDCPSPQLDFLHVALLQIVAEYFRIQLYKRLVNFLILNHLINAIQLALKIL